MLSVYRSSLFSYFCAKEGLDGGMSRKAVTADLSDGCSGFKMSPEWFFDRIAGFRGLPGGDKRKDHGSPRTLCGA